MASLLNCSDLEKAFGVTPLFRGIGLNIAEGDRIGVLGPNGAGKSTLLKILAGIETADGGNILRKKGLRLGYLPQEENFAANATVRDVLRDALANEHLPEDEQWGRIGEVASVIGFSELDDKVAILSGGWQKRVALAAQLIRRPELLLLDEPTNHLDLEGIQWLEQFILDADCAFVVISHDRTLLENVTSRIFEINRIYPQGCFTTDGNYSQFLERRENFLQGISRYEDSLRNKVRREIEWLRRGPKARSTKAKGRINEAGRLIGELKEYESRSGNQRTADIDFQSSGRKTQKLIALERVSKSLGQATLFRNLTFTLSPGMRVGVVGANGSGKSTLLKLLDGSLTPDSGTVTTAPRLRLVKFDQNREALNKELTLQKTLSPDGDSVIYREREIHVATWATRFLFRSEQLRMPIRSLSGGEQARLLIAKLMLQPADVLLLDEPTNDLDIDTLQVLEESLEEFAGAIVLVTHDRFMLDRISTTVLGLSGTGRAEFFASYMQWEAVREEFLREVAPAKTKGPQILEAAPSEKRKISFEEQKELSRLERKIAKLEDTTAKLKTELLQEHLADNPTLLSELYLSLQEKERELELLVEQWSEIEAKK